MLREDCPQCPWWPEERELGPEGDPLPRLFNDDFTDFRGGEGQVNASTISVFTDPHVPQVRACGGDASVGWCWAKGSARAWLAATTQFCHYQWARTREQRAPQCVQTASSSVPTA